MRRRRSQRPGQEGGSGRGDEVSPCIVQDAGAMTERRPSLSSALRIDGASRDTLADRAYRSIRVAIINHELVPGRYYSEAWLAGLLGVSRTPTHYALLQLEIEGIVEIAAQRGFRLRDIPESEFNEFYEVRIILETNVLRKLEP